MLCFFFQAEDGIRDGHVTGVQTCALPILEKYGVNTTEDVKIPYISTLKELSYKDTEVHEDLSNTYDVALTFDRRYLEKIMNRLSFYHFSNLKRYIPLLKSREEFLDEKWLNIFNRTIYEIGSASCRKSV